MANDPKVIQDTYNAIAAVLTRHLAPLFRDDVRLTFIARTPGHPERTVVLSSDDLAAVVTPEILATTTDTTPGEK